MSLILILAEGIIALFGCAFWLGVLYLVTRQPHRPSTQAVIPTRPQDRPEFEFLFGQECLICGTTVDLCWDHITPASWGGSDGIENMQRLCRQHNIEKGSTYADYRSAQQKQWIEDRL